MIKAAEERPFRSAKKFIEALRPANDDWVFDKYWHSYWLFRGQCDADWTLTPTAWRTDKDSQTQRILQHYRDFNREHHESAIRIEISRRSGGEKPTRSLKTTTQLNIAEAFLQAYAELRSVNVFISTANKVGHPVESVNIPESDNFASQYLENMESGGNNQIWMSDIVAVARHHGIPSRLLDWTENPLVAAFFAAEGIDVDRNKGKRLAVFAFNRPMSSVVDPGRIKVKAVSAYKSSYIHAQHAVFTLDTLADKWFIEHGHWPTFEDAVRESFFPSPQNHLKKYTLPVTQAGELLRLLWLEGISRAHLMPTLDNVTAAIGTQTRWAEHQNPERMPKLRNKD